MLKNGCRVVLWVEKQLLPILCVKGIDRSTKRWLKVTMLEPRRHGRHGMKANCSGRQRVTAGDIVTSSRPQRGKEVLMTRSPSGHTVV